MSLPKITTLKLMKLHPAPPVQPQPRDIVRDVCVVPTYREVRPNNYPPSLCKKCDAPIWKSGLCQDHWQERASAKKQHQREFERTRRMEPVRYEPTPLAKAMSACFSQEELELRSARHRFPLVPQMSDEELLKFHREHPRGWDEACGGEA